MNTLIHDRKEELIYALLDYHLLLKVKGPMDQFIEGLKNLGVYGAVSKNPETFREFFTYRETPVTAGENRVQLHLMHCILNVNAAP
jgi:hypothetical protein